jgi:hypothetical protein
VVTTALLLPAAGADGPTASRLFDMAVKRTEQESGALIS